MQKIDQSELKSLLHYNPDNGLFTWISAQKNHMKANSIAGSVSKSGKNKGYCNIKIEGKLYMAHRLAFLYMTGHWPSDEIDHINHTKGDNRWCNLREATRIENSRNQSIPRHNTSGTVGVCWVARYRRWQAQISVGGRRIYLGIFKDKKDAINARKEADIKYGFHENHGVEVSND